jgi:uncharacterized membrane protein (DUF2068 family)
MDPEVAPAKKVPTLYFIIALKLVKGFLLVALALGIYKLSGKNLGVEYDQLLRLIRLDPEANFFGPLGDQLDKITIPIKPIVATSTFIYSLFSLTEGIGLIFRVPWAGWLAIGESVFFIPLELYELKQSFTWIIFIILLVNIAIVYYLLKNRNRLFKHVHHH